MAIKELPPLEAHRYLQQTPAALFVDCRTSAERQFVGYPTDSQWIMWSDGPDTNWQLNPRFIEQVRENAGKHAEERPVVLICRSGQRSLAAAKALDKAGFKEIINVIHGFEGPLDSERHRNALTGWRAEGLPWEQD